MTQQNEMTAASLKVRRAKAETRRKEVAKLHQEGWTPAQMAAELDVHVQTISRDLKKLKATNSNVL